MAGDWIKMRTDLDEDPAVIAIAELTGLTEHTVVGKLWKLWSWADRQSADGQLHVSMAWIDRHLNVPGFAQAMLTSGWLKIENDNLFFPNFDRHMSQTAKRRALNVKYQRQHRALTNCLPEKRREEKNKEEAYASCSEPQKAASEPPVLTFPCKGLGPKEWHLTASKLAEYRDAFPGIDALAECRKALQWCRDNPSKRKTVRGMTKFLGAWLGRAQDEAPRTARPGLPGPDRRETIGEKLRRLEEEQCRPSRNGQSGTPPSSD